MKQFLDELAAYLSCQPFPVTSIAAGQPGGEIARRVLIPDNPCQNIYSVAKLFTATAVGILWDRGRIGLEEPIGDILKIPAGSDTGWRVATVDMALRHRLGLPQGFLDIDVTPSTAFGQDFLNYLFAQPLLCAPGTAYSYTDGAYYLLSRIVEERCGQPLDTFLWRELFCPMGFLEAAWSRCPLGHPIGATGLYIRVEDMLKLGLLYLNDGRWAHRRILSEAWCAKAKARHYGMDGDPCPGLLCKGGMCGQLLCMDTKNNRALAVQSYGADTGAILSWLRQHI